MRSVRDLFDLSGRCALVAGGAGHVGRAATAALLELGARVAVVDLAPGGAGETLSVETDLADEAATRSAVGRVAGELGGIDVLVHCAALVGTTEEDGWAVPFADQSVSAWEKALRVNLTSAFVLAHEAREHLARSASGSIVLVSSIYGLVGPDLRLYEGTSMGNPAGYAASKAGLVQLARHLATVLAPTRANAVSPGGIAREQDEAFVERYVERTPLRRMATEEDLKGAVAYLASDASAYVTGQNLVVDGGWTAW